MSFTSTSLSGKFSSLRRSFDRPSRCCRCSQSVDFSLRCAWLLDAYISDQMRSARRPNAAVQLLFDILYEKYKPKIIYNPTTINGSTTSHHRLDEEEADDEMRTERTFSQENVLAVPSSRKKGHQKSRSDVSGKTTLFRLRSARLTFVSRTLSLLPS